MMMVYATPQYRVEDRNVNTRTMIVIPVQLPPYHHHHRYRSGAMIVSQSFALPGHYFGMAKKESERRMIP